jgi:RHS repeat-associated protein
LVEAKDGATVIGVYEYDGRHRRVKRHVDTDAPVSPDGVDTYVHYFYNQQWQVLETRETATESDQPESLQPQYQYVWSPRYIDAVVLRDENTDADGLCDDQRLYYLNDANFNVTCLVDTGGDAIERYLYEPYGVLSVMDGSFGSRSASSYDNPYTFTGRRLDAETGLYYYRHRFLTAELGRFVGRDPIGYVDGGNLYSLNSGRTTVSVDPSGTKTCRKSVVSTRRIGSYGRPYAIGALNSGSGSSEDPKFLSDAIVCERRVQVDVLCKEECDYRMGFCGFGQQIHYVRFYHMKTMAFEKGRIWTRNESNYQLVTGGGSALVGYLDVPIGVLEELFGDGIQGFTYTTILDDWKRANSACRHPGRVHWSGYFEPSTEC